jgi:hypothetical protein
MDILCALDAFGLLRGYKEVQMLKFHTRTGAAFAVAALLAVSGASSVRAQSSDSTNGTYIGNFDNPAQQPTWPLGAGVTTGTYGASFGVGNGNASVGAGSDGNGQVHNIGASTGLPNTSALTSKVPQTCVEYPGVDVLANCQ